MTRTRKVLAVVLALLAVLMGYVTLTIPAFEATAPAIFTVALVAGAWLVWPKRRRAAQA